MSNSLKIERLEAEITALKEQNTQLELNAQKLKDELNFVINYSQDTKKSIFKIRELEEANFDLKTLIARKESEFKLERRGLESKHDIEINKLKSEIQLINHKYDTMMRYELYIKKIEEINRELTQKLKEMEEEYAHGMKEEENKFQIKLGLMQQKTLNILGESKKNIQNNAMLNMNNSYKLINLQVNELHHQLSEQSAMLEELLKQLNKKEKHIQSLKISISVYKEVEKIIVTQNRRLSKMIKQMLENKRIEGETKQYMHESRKLLHILKNEEMTETEEDSFDEKIGEYEGSNAYNKLKNKFGFGKNYNGDANEKNHFDKGNFASQDFLSPKSNANANPNYLINKEMSKIKLIKMANTVGIFDSPVKLRKVKDPADKINVGYNSDYYEKANSKLINIDKHTIIGNNNFNENNNRNGNVNKSNSKTISNDNIFAKFLRNTFDNFPDKSNSTKSESLNKDFINPYQNSTSNKTNIQNYYKNLHDSKDLTGKNSSKKNLPNFANSSINSTIHISNNINIGEKNNCNLMSSTINIKEESNSLEASAAKGHFNNIKGKSYNNSSVLDDMNTTMELGNTFVKNSGFNNLNNYNFSNYNLKKNQNKGKDDFRGLSEAIEAKSNNLSLNNAASYSNNLGNVEGSYKENEIDVDLAKSSEMINEDQKINESKRNLTDKIKKKANFSITNKLDKMLKNSKFIRNNQILDKYEAELIRSRDNEILGLN